MHHDLGLFATITMAILTAFAGGYAARRLGLPPMVGYLLAGMAIGPFTPGFVGDVGEASQLAEMGVIFMMFGVGLHFSLDDMWAVRSIAIPGAILQTVLATLLGVGLTQLWGWSLEASLVLGLSISIASTVVLLRGLQDNGLIDTAHGKVAIGWLVLEDLATVAILVLLPAVVGDQGDPLASGALAIAKTVVFVALMIFVGRRVLPWLLMHIAHMHSRELFILAVVGIALGTAFGAAELFGVSLALGAFLAGVIIGESGVSHQVGAEVLPFREVFSVLFFVSVGMLVNPASIVENFGHLVLLTLLIIAGKGLITLSLGLVLPSSARTMVVVAVGLAQIGEFSFIVGQSGVALGVLSTEQYGLILAASLVTIVINPLLYHALPHLETGLKRLPAVWGLINRGGPTPEAKQYGLSGHVVVVGYGSIGRPIGGVLEGLNIPFLVIEQDADRAAALQAQGINTLFGNAADSEIMKHVGLDKARVLVVCVRDETTTELVVAAAHDIAPNLPIIARASTTEGIKRLAEHGANYILHPELEGSLEAIRHTLLELGYPTGLIQRYVDRVRQDGYGEMLDSHKEHLILEQLIRKANGMEIAWSTVAPDSPVVGKKLSEVNLRAEIGASVIAIVRGDQVMPNPKSNTVFAAGDLVGLIGDAAELAAAGKLLNAFSIAG